MGQILQCVSKIGGFGGLHYAIDGLLRQPLRQAVLNQAVQLHYTAIRGKNKIGEHRCPPKRFIAALGLYDYDKLTAALVGVCRRVSSAARLGAGVNLIT